MFLAEHPAVPDRAVGKTTVLDLGEISEPVLVFGGPYSNLQATAAMMQSARNLGIKPGRVICTGDIVAYCGNPEETTDIIRDAGIHVIQGNCEISFGNDADSCGCGFDAGTTCDRLSVQWYDFAKNSLSQEAATWMSTLPTQIRFQMGGKSLAVVHGAPSSVNQFVFPSTAVETKLSEITEADCDGIICGHSGLPFTQIFDGLLWHNAGAIGLPANDGTRRTWFSMITPDKQGLRFEHLPLEYDAEAASGEMLAAGLPNEYANALTSGLWDNCDILPAQETNQQGVPLSFESTYWSSLRHTAE